MTDPTREPHGAEASKSQLPQPSVSITDADREVIVRQIQQALARDEIEFDELDDRFALVYAAQTRAELDAVTSDLPAPPPPMAAPVLTHPTAPTSISIFGDVKRGGDFSVGANMSCATVFGDVLIDLSTSELVEGARISGHAVFGDITIILPDGVRVSRSAFTIFGDQKERVVAPVAGAPTIHVTGRTIFGDVKFYSLSQIPEGKLRKIWKALRR